MNDFTFANYWSEGSHGPEPPLETKYRIEIQRGQLRAWDGKGREVPIKTLANGISMFDPYFHYHRLPWYVRLWRWLKARVGR